MNTAVAQSLTNGVAWKPITGHNTIYRLLEIERISSNSGFASSVG